MSYELNFLKTSELNTEIINNLSFWSKPDFLNTYSIRDNTPLSYLIISKSSKIMMIMPIFEKKKLFFKYINQLPEHYYTTIDFFFSKELNNYEIQNQTIEILKTLSSFLKKEYLKISLNIDYKLNDMRGFIWSGLSSEPLYTLRKRISEYSPNQLPRMQKRKLKKSTDSELTVSSEWNTSIVKDLLKNLSQRKNRPLRQTQDNYLNFLNNLKSLNICEMFTVFHKSNPIAFRILLKNHQNSFLYDFVAAGNETGNQLGANIFCLDYLFTNFKDYEYFDFCGANTENIAFFKSQFNCDLINYYRIKKSI